MRDTVLNYAVYKQFTSSTLPKYCSICYIFTTLGILLILSNTAVTYRKRRKFGVTKVWRINAISPNFICQNIKVLYISNAFLKKFAKLYSRQTFIVYGIIKMNVLLESICLLLCINFLYVLLNVWVIRSKPMSGSHASTWT